MAEWEYLLDQKSLLKRVQEQRKLREAKDVQIVEFQDQYQEAFKALNEQWISTYFEIEEEDSKALDNPKMAVSPDVQGKSIGWLLGQAVVNAAKELGASKLYLESNTLLKSAINLYHKLGFKKVVGRATPYTRCNIQMELMLKNQNQTT